jgi:hypothetical protein
MMNTVKKITSSYQRRNMRTVVSPETAERRVVHKFNKLYVPLMELYNAVQDMAPFATYVDAVLSSNEVGKVQVALTTKPIRLTIQDKQKAMTLEICPARDLEQLRMRERRRVDDQARQ